MPDKISEYILNHSKHKNQELKYDFMPNILEIIERPANKAGEIIIYSIFSLLIVALIWTNIAKTDVVVTASGSVVPEGDVITVKSYVSGTVEKIYVSNGQNVKKGDILIQLNSDIKADITQLNNQIKISSAELDVYEKLLNNTDISKISSDDYDDNYKSYIEAIIETQNSYLISRETLKLSQTSAKLEYDSAVAMMKSYEGTELYESQSKIVEQKKMLKEEADLKIKSLDAQHKQEINNSYSTKKSELNDLNSQLEKYQQNEKYCKIIAPEDGCISNITVNSLGDTVTQYEELITIIPQKESLQMKCYIQNKDIADIDIGDTVQIKLDAYSYSDYGTIPGKVIYISPDSYMLENLGKVYEVTAEIENDNKDIDIVSGLSGSMEIKIGERTVLSYFLEPVLNGFNNSLKEK